MSEFRVQDGAFPPGIVDQIGDAAGDGDDVAGLVGVREVGQFWRAFETSGQEMVEVVSTRLQADVDTAGVEFGDPLDNTGESGFEMNGHDGLLAEIGAYPVDRIKSKGVPRGGQTKYFKPAPKNFV